VLHTTQRRVYNKQEKGKDKRQQKQHATYTQLNSLSLVASLLASARGLAKRYRSFKVIKAMQDYEISQGLSLPENEYRL